jgi:transglutaminase/protease-like cytokinesis protein 3
LQVYEYDDFYFLTDPEQLVYSHWAHKKEWQLLVQPISLEDFQNLPLVKSYFFKCAMFFVSHHKGVVDTRKGKKFSSQVIAVLAIMFADT